MSEISVVVKTFCLPFLSGLGVVLGERVFSFLFNFGDFLIDTIGESIDEIELLSDSERLEDFLRDFEGFFGGSSSVCFLEYFFLTGVTDEVLELQGGRR